MMKFKNFILDVDGVLTDGKFHYTDQGKVMKVFGSDDADALNLIKDDMNILFISGDKKGFEISKKRVEDMGFEIRYASTSQRVNWIKTNCFYNLNETIYMGDGIFDSLVFDEVGFSIAPANAFEHTKKQASIVTKRKGGEGAVAEAVFYIITELMEKHFDLKKLLNK